MSVSYKNGFSILFNLILPTPLLGISFYFNQKLYFDQFHYKYDCLYNFA